MAPLSDGWTVFSINLYLAEKVLKISKVSRAPHNINPGPAMTWLVGVIIYCTILK